MEDKQCKLLLAHVEDKIQFVIKEHRIQYTSFLDPASQKRVQDLLNKCPQIGYQMFGGYPESERKLFLLYPEYVEPEDLSFPIKGIVLNWNRHYHNLSHRDVLGALMGLGLKREKIGDIIMVEDSASVFVLEDIAPYIVQHLKAVGRATVEVQELDYNQIKIPQPKIKTIQATVSSPRLDSVMSAGFGISRKKSLPFIRSGNVSVNWEVTDKADYLLKEGDMISVRGMGRVRVSEIGGSTKKGRVKIFLERFL